MDCEADVGLVRPRCPYIAGYAGGDQLVKRGRDELTGPTKCLSSELLCLWGLTDKGSDFFCIFKH